VELEHLKIETTLIDEMFTSVMGEYAFLKLFIVYYESIKRELKIKSIYECRCDERLHWWVYGEGPQ
jgi:hypothetical protein